MDDKMLSEIGKKKNLKNKEHIEKDYFQDILLYKLFSKSNDLVFKGGTALYKIYNLPRFSEDLDFSILHETDAEKTIMDIAKSVGDVEFRKTPDSLLFKIKFKGILTRYNTIRIDVSTKNKILAGFDVKNYVAEYVDINPFSLKVMKPNEMVAEKIHSLFARKKARDLYDLFFLLRLSNFDCKLVETKLKIFQIKFSLSRLKKAINNLESVWEPELKPFMLSEIPSFAIVRDFVLSRITKHI